MPTRFYKMRGRVWIYPGEAAWHFISLPKNKSAEIKKIFGPLAQGFQSLPVNVVIGETTWKTSIFPDNKRAAYLLPLKAEVRKKENIREGDSVNFQIEIIV